ncbi:putative PurR-regulated permease PerM [Bartonella japonica]|uniref:PurR-regulated permease PerM n=1 Tax=Bartonella japonica TaxID=357761 RepID=A0ABV2FPT0_9HYPH
MDNKKIDTSKDHLTEQSTLLQDPPLHPSVERVRKKLMLLMIISISITLVLILAVLFGVIYKIVTTESSSKQADLFSSHKTNQKVIHHTLSLPKNTQILSQSLSEHNIVLKILTQDGQIKFMIYNYHTGALITVLSVEITEEIPTIRSH